MSENKSHIAQINIAHMLFDRDQPGMAGFMDNLDRINTLAESSDGFMWRLKDDSGNATDIQAFDNPRILINISVWESTDALYNFVYKTVHKKFVGRRTQWFEPATQPGYAIWPVAPGHKPKLAEGIAKLDQFRHNGASATVFDFTWWKLQHAS